MNNQLNEVIRLLLRRLVNASVFLQIDKKVFLPTFDDEEKDRKAFNRFVEIFGEGNVYEIPSAEIAKGGGGLNCLSWEISD
ncbi:MAG: hypothetical protein EOM90_00005 [Alphaproteobacteria bacterium]|nr:hypothetical protein [Alphaproteobacteria bacterium]